MITREQAEEFIHDQGGKIFKVVFTKKDGTERVMVCRRGVKSHLKGGVLRYNPKDYDLITVFDMQKKQYRSINMATIKEITVQGETYSVETNS